MKIRFQIQRQGQREQLRDGRRPYARATRAFKNKGNKPARGNTQDFLNEMMNEMDFSGEEIEFIS